MKRPVLVSMVLSLAACSSSHGNGDDDYMVQPGGAGGVHSGGGGDTGPTGDGGIDALTGDAGVPISGRACLLTDLRQIGVASACLPTGAGNLTVSLGNRTATTADSGAFTIIAPAGGGLVWHVTGDQLSASTAIEPSVMPFGTDATIPVISVSNYTDLLSQNSVEGQAGLGSVFLRALTNGAVTADVTAVSSPAAQRGVLYDTGSSVVWTDNLTGTGNFGVLWLPNVQVGSATVTLTPMGATTPTKAYPPVEDQAITFLQVELQ